jgi:hypothetical protein
MDVKLRPTGHTSGPPVTTTESQGCGSSGVSTGCRGQVVPVVSVVRVVQAARAGAVRAALVTTSMWQRGGWDASANNPSIRGSAACLEGSPYVPFLTSRAPSCRRSQAHYPHILAAIPVCRIIVDSYSRIPQIALHDHSRRPGESHRQPHQSRSAGLSNIVGQNTLYQGVSDPR